MSENNSNELFDNYCNVIKEISSCMNDYLYIYDFLNDIYFIDERAVERFAVPSGKFKNVIENHKKFVYGPDYNMLSEDISCMIAGTKETHNLRYRWIGIDGKPIWINCRGKLLRDDKNRPFCMVGCINEIGKKQKADNVSGFLGEMSFQEVIKNKETLEDGYIIKIGIDNFKKINAKNGNVIGDEILLDVAKAIKNNLKANQSAYRIVSDEFMISDFNGGTMKEAKELYHRIRTEISNNLEKNGYKVFYTISAGIVNNADINDTSKYEDIIKLSQFSLNRAKENGKNKCYFFDYKEYEKFKKIREIELKIRKSIQNNYEGFSLNYQPIVDALHEKTLFAEALLRYKTEDGESIAPSEMIPLLEETGLIIPVGRWVLKNALLTCKEIRKKFKNFKISVNLSYVQILNSDIFEDILNTLKEIEINSDALIVEMTESGSLENRIEVKTIWNNLKKQGIQIALDDFGSGYSNFKYICDLKPDYIKNDRDFTINSINDPFSFMILTNMISMSHELNSKFIIEGIENEAEFKKIKQASPDYIQGYLFGKPCDKEKFIKMIMN